MSSKLVLRLVLFSLILASCNFTEGGNKIGDNTPTSTVATVLSTPTSQIKATLVVKATHTPVQLATLVPTEPPTLLPLEPSSTSFPVEWYIVQPGTPLATYNTPQEAAGCSWLGVGGQVFGVDTAPVPGLSILVGGTLDGHQVGSLGVTGMETNIGEGGYEITLADHAIDSSGTLWIQIVDEIGNPLSDKVYFSTFNDCDRNFILINFVRYQASLPSGSSWPAYLPLITNPRHVQITPTP